MIYTTQTILSNPPSVNLEPSPNFGSLGLPDTVDVFYENNSVPPEWVSIKSLLPFRNTSTSTTWPVYIDEWQAAGPVPETEWSGRFKICFDLNLLSCSVFLGNLNADISISNAFVSSSIN